MDEEEKKVHFLLRRFFHSGLWTGSSLNCITGIANSCERRKFTSWSSQSSPSHFPGTGKVEASSSHRNGIKELRTFTRPLSQYSTILCTFNTLLSCSSANPYDAAQQAPLTDKVPRSFKPPAWEICSFSNDPEQTVSLQGYLATHSVLLTSQDKQPAEISLTAMLAHMSNIQSRGTKASQRNEERSFKKPLLRIPSKAIYRKHHILQITEKKSHRFSSSSTHTIIQGRKKRNKTKRIYNIMHVQAQDKPLDVLSRLAL